MFDFIKKILSWTGRDIADYEFTTYGSYLAATDLTGKEIEMMRGSAEYAVEKRIEPISGHICELSKGTYFVPTCTTIPIMKIDCKPRKPWGVIPEDSPYSLKPGYTNEP